MGSGLVACCPVPPPAVSTPPWSGRSGPLVAPADAVGSGLAPSSCGVVGSSTVPGHDLDAGAVVAFLDGGVLRVLEVAAGEVGLQSHRAFVAGGQVAADLLGGLGDDVGHAGRQGEGGQVGLGVRGGLHDLGQGRFDLQVVHRVVLTADAGVGAARRQPGGLPEPVSVETVDALGRVGQRQPATGDVADLDGDRLVAPRHCGGEAVGRREVVDGVVGLTVDAVRCPTATVELLEGGQTQIDGRVGRCLVGDGEHRVSAAQVVTEVDQRVDAGRDPAGERPRILLHLGKEGRHHEAATEHDRPGQHDNRSGGGAPADSQHAEEQARRQQVPQRVAESGAHHDRHGQQRQHRGRHQGGGAHDRDRGIREQRAADHQQGQQQHDAEVGARRYPLLLDRLPALGDDGVDRVAALEGRQQAEERLVAAETGGDAQDAEADRDERRRPARPGPRSRECSRQEHAGGERGADQPPTDVLQHGVQAAVGGQQRAEREQRRTPVDGAEPGARATCRGARGAGRAAGGGCRGRTRAGGGAHAPTPCR